MLQYWSNACLAIGATAVSTAAFVERPFFGFFFGLLALICGNILLIFHQRRKGNHD